MGTKPWVEGPLELLRHGAGHLELGEEFDSRIAMISVDNAVELMIKTYLGLPRRATGIVGLSRKKFDEITQSFPLLLDALEKFAGDKLVGIELADIEWYHRLRNQLYHDGNGITVARMRVEAYLEIAKILLTNLFATPAEEILIHESTNLLVLFIHKWVNLEQELLKLQAYRRIPDNVTVAMTIEWLCEDKILPNNFLANFRELRQLRNKLMHAKKPPSTLGLREAITKVQNLYGIVKASYI